MDTDDFVLIVEDDTPTAASMVGALSRAGYEVTVAISGHDALDRCAAAPPDAITTELRLPDIDGVELCRLLRDLTEAPIIVVTADSGEDRMIAALDAGADDFIPKPFSMPQLLARVRAALRRRDTDHVETGGPHVLHVGDLTIDLDSRVVQVAAARVRLSPKEFDFLAVLARHPGRVFTHDQLLRRIWGADAAGKTEYLRVVASQIRKKLSQHPRAPRVVNEPWVGYQLAADP